LPSISLTGTPNMRAAVSRAALITHPAVGPSLIQSKIKISSRKCSVVCTKFSVDEPNRCRLAKENNLTSVKLKYTVQVLSMEDEQAKLAILQKMHLYASLKFVSAQ